MTDRSHRVITCFPCGKNTDDTFRLESIRHNSVPSIHRVSFATHHDFKNCNCSHVSGSFLYTGFYGLTENQCRDLKLGPWVKLKVKVSFCCWVTTVRKEQGQGFPPGWMMLFRKEWRTVSLRHPGWVCKRWFGGLGFQNYFGAKSEELVKTTMLQTKLWQGCGYSVANCSVAKKIMKLCGK